MRAFLFMKFNCISAAGNNVDALEDEHPLCAMNFTLEIFSLSILFFMHYYKVKHQQLRSIENVPLVKFFF